MLFNISKQKSSAFIKLFVTLAIIFVPTFLNMLSLEASVNLMFVISSVVFLMHIKANERLNISLGHIIYMAIIAFGVLSLIWVNNRSGQFTYIFAVALTGIFGSVFKEYFSESILPGKKILVTPQPGQEKPVSHKMGHFMGITKNSAR